MVNRSSPGKIGDDERGIRQPFPQPISITGVLPQAVCRIRRHQMRLSPPLLNMLPPRPVRPHGYRVLRVLIMSNIGLTPHLAASLVQCRSIHNHQTPITPRPLRLRIHVFGKVMFLGMAPPVPANTLSLTIKVTAGASKQ